MRAVLEHVRHLILQKELAGLTDGQLLECFLLKAEEAAFTALMHHHAAMVLGVCRRVLRHVHDAEDAFQATFMVLARKAKTIIPRDAVGPWLYGVAFRTAMKAKTMTAKRRAKEERFRASRKAETTVDVVWDDLQPLLDEELSRLPANYQSAIVLCDLEGKSRKQAAVQLHCPEGTLSGWLTRGRRLLAARLTKRGVALSAGALAGVLSQNALSASVPAALMVTTGRAATLIAAGQSAASAIVSPQVAALSQAVVGAMFVSKLKLGSAIVLVVSVAAVGIAGAVRSVAEPAATSGIQQPAASGKAAATDRYGDALPGAALARLGTTRLRHADTVCTVALSGDGKSVLSADWHGVSVWDKQTGKEIRHFGDPWGTQFQSVASSADAKTVVLTRSEGVKGNVEVWDAESGRVRLRFTTGRFPEAVLSPDGKTLALQASDQADQKSLSLWDTETGKELRRLRDSQQAQEVFAFSGDGRALATVNNDEASVCVWEVSSGKQLHRFGIRACPLGRVAVSPDGKTLAGVSLKKFQGQNFSGYVPLNDVVLLDLTSGKVAHRLEGHQNGAQALTFTPDGQTLVTADWERLRFWQVATGKEAPERQLPAPRLSSLTYSRDGNILATGSLTGTVKLWAPATGKQFLPQGGHEGSVHVVALSPDGKTAATASGENTLRLWEARVGKEAHVLPGHEGGVLAAAFLPDGRTLVSIGRDNTLRSWDVRTGRQLRQDRLSEAARRTLAVAPGGRLIALGGEKEIILWDLAANQEVRRLPAGGSVAFVPDGKTLLSWADDRLVHVWDVGTGKERRRFDGPHFSEDAHDRIYCIAFSPDGKLVAFGGQVPPIVICELSTGKQTQQLSGLPGATSTLAFAPDGQTLASGDWTGGAAEPRSRGTVRLWDLATGQSFLQLDGHRGRVVALSFSGDAQLLASGSVDGTALVWDVSDRRLAKPGNGALTPQQLDALWADLVQADAVRAHQAMGTLLAVPKQAVPYLCSHLRPVKPADARQVTRLLAELDSDDFSRREQAGRTLEGLGESAEPMVRNKLARGASPEVSARLEKFLKKLDDSPVRLRARRAVRVLEQLDRPEAGEALTALSGGAAGAWLTQEADAALKRRTAVGTPGR